MSLTRLDLMLRQLVPSSGQERVRQTVNDLLTTVRQEARAAAFKEAIQIAKEGAFERRLAHTVYERLLAAAANLSARGW